MRMAFNPALYLVTNSDNRSEPAFLEIIAQACAGGVTLVQLREKEKAGREYYKLAVQVKAVTDRFKTPLIIDDRLDVALAVGAAGVHLGQDDLPLEEARKLLGPEKILGATAKTLEQARAAEAAGADYLGVGAVFPTTTKVKTVITSVETLHQIVRSVNIPVIAIGGLNERNLEILYGSEVSGIAVVTAIMNSSDPHQTVVRLRELTETRILAV